MQGQTLQAKAFQSNPFGRSNGRHNGCWESMSHISTQHRCQVETSCGRLIHSRTSRQGYIAIGGYDNANTVVKMLGECTAAAQIHTHKRSGDLYSRALLLANITLLTAVAYMAIDRDG